MGVVCKKCGEPKPDGGRCRACQRIYMRKRYKDDPESFKQANKRWAKKHPNKKKDQQDRWKAKNPERWKELRQKWSKNWKRTTVRGILCSSLAPKRSGKNEVSVDVDYLVDLWEQQNGLCALTGLPMLIMSGLSRVSFENALNRCLDSLNCL